jgi:hypothetical protein
LHLIPIPRRNLDGTAHLDRCVGDREPDLDLGGPRERGRSRD